MHMEVRDLPPGNEKRESYEKEVTVFNEKYLIVEELKKYKCQKGPVGCIQVIGECLEEFLG